MPLVAPLNRPFFFLSLLLPSARCCSRRPCAAETAAPFLRPHSSLAHLPSGCSIMPTMQTPAAASGRPAARPAAVAAAHAPAVMSAQGQSQPLVQARAGVAGGRARLSRLMRDARCDCMLTVATAALCRWLPLLLPRPALCPSLLHSLLQTTRFCLRYWIEAKVFCSHLPRPTAVCRSCAFWLRTIRFCCATI